MKSSRILLSFLFAFAAIHESNASPARRPSLVKDANEKPKSMYTEDFLKVGSKIFFTANDEKHGLELWMSNGRPSSGKMLKDINPGPYGSAPRILQSINGIVYFTADDGKGDGAELWRSDGTEKGTFRTGTFSRGVANASGISDISDSGAFKSSLYVLTRRGEETGEIKIDLWLSNGKRAPEGTQLVKNLCTGTATACGTWAGVRAGTNTIYFTSEDDASGLKLWVSDGTSEGTKSIAAFSGRGIATATSLVIGNLLYFAADDGSHGYELWKSDGTPAGTALLKDINPGKKNTSFANFTAFGEVLVFTARTQPGGDTLWLSDGKTGVTVQLGVIDAGGDARPRDLYALGETILFSALTKDEGREPWIYDLDKGLRILKDINPGNTSSSPDDFAALNGAIYFIATDNTHGRGIWRNDAVEGAVFVIDVADRPGIDDDYSRLREDGGSLYYFDTDSTGTQLWKSDGTAAGSRKLTSFVSLADNFPIIPIYSGDGIGFLFREVDGTEKLYGVSGNTVAMEKNFKMKGTATSDAQILTGIGNLLYFRADDGVHGQELWRSDGTKAGTWMLKDIRTGSSGGMSEGLVPYAVLGTTLYFLANSTDELWKTNGTGEGTQKVTDVSGYRLAAANNSLFFVRGGSLWKSDGTEAGTSLVLNPPGGSSVDSLSFTVVGNSLYFVTRNPADQRTLWKSDGSTAGTIPLHAFETHKSLLEVAAAGSHFFFTVEDSAHGIELWKSDGTASGTALVKDILPGSAGSAPQNLTAVGSTLYFRASGATKTGVQIWKTDGSESGTFLVKDYGANAKIESVHLVGELLGKLFYATVMKNSKEALVFKAYLARGSGAGRVVRSFSIPKIGLRPDFSLATGASGGFLTVCGYFGGTQGCHLFKTDGTRAGTYEFPDIRSEGANTVLGYSPMKAVNRQLFLVADDGVHGRELWKIREVMPTTRDLNTISLTASAGENGAHLLSGAAYTNAGVGIPSVRVTVTCSAPGKRQSRKLKTGAGGIFSWEINAPKPGTKCIASALAGQREIRSRRVGF